MACYYPIHAYRGRTQANGKMSIVWEASEGLGRITLPCGRCVGCRLERSRQWMIRCLHESKQYDDNCYITLTYDNTFIPEHGSLKVKDFQDFMKRLRKYVQPVKIRFFHCGEYGDLYGRPHYHAIIFNYDFPDKVLISDDGISKKFSSAILDNIWQKGRCTVGTVCKETIGYVARYCLKKITGKHADEWYGDLKPEYVTMSRRPGIGATWFDKYKDDVYPSDEVVIDGMSMRPPKFYDKRLSEIDPVRFQKVKASRSKFGEWDEEGMPWRLADKEYITLQRIGQLSRSFEEGGPHGASL